MDAKVRGEIETVRGIVGPQPECADLGAGRQRLANMAGNESESEESPRENESKARAARTWRRRGSHPDAT